MTKKQATILLEIFITILTIFTVFTLIDLNSNETYLKTTFKTSTNKEIFIPKHSYFKEDKNNKAVFYSLKSKEDLEIEINNYLKDFSSLSNIQTISYIKGDLIIKSYTVKNAFFVRKIVIEY